MVDPPLWAAEGLFLKRKKKLFTGFNVRKRPTYFLDKTSKTCCRVHYYSVRTHHFRKWRSTHESLSTNKHHIDFSKLIWFCQVCSSDFKTWRCQNFLFISQFVSIFIFNLPPLPGFPGLLVGDLYTKFPFSTLKENIKLNYLKTILKKLILT